jgi:serine/threonine-protein kinase PknG
VEVDLRLAATMIDVGSLDEADAQLAEVQANDPWDWRVAWYRGIAALARGRADEARASFEIVYRAVPGELAPKLALGLACELGRVPGGDMGAAGRWYEIVARTDPSITTASFGLARCRLEAGDRAGALAAYERVPDTSSGYIDAQTARIRCLSRDGEGESGLQELLAAGSALEALPVAGEQRERLTADLLESALRMTLSGRALADGSTRLLGLPLVERDVRLALERSYRELARHAPRRSERIELVDDANRVRPRTWT